MATVLTEWKKKCNIYFFNPLSTNAPLLNPLKTSETRRFSVFRGYRSGTLVENGLTLHSMNLALNKLNKLNSRFLKPAFRFKKIDNDLQYSKFRGSNRFYSAEVPWTSILRNWFLDFHESLVIQYTLFPLKTRKKAKSLTFSLNLNFSWRSPVPGRLFFIRIIPAR